MQKTVVMSVGGSIINPGTIDTRFLLALKKMLDSIDSKFVIVCGGGAPARAYINAARTFGIARTHLDEIGVRATQLNAELMRHILSAPPVQQQPKRVKFSKYLIGCGWKPGTSTDYDAVLWANLIHADTIVNLTNTDYVYTKDPREPGAKPLPALCWKHYLKLIGPWTSGGHAPFDPIASRLAQKGKKCVVVANGTKLANLRNLLSGKKFTGTVIA